MADSYLALTCVCAEAITLPFFVASTRTFHVPGIGACPLPMNIWRAAAQGNSKELFISDIFIEGIAGMVNVTVT
jgi:hypothetical protein